jgi:glyoxylase-like metal-dependent hydrolase (beta-lactamase superfamily II)
MPFHPIKTQKLADNLYAVNCLMVNFYIFDTGKNLIAFDTGLNLRNAARGMKKLGLSPDKVTHVFLTHSDFDHTGGLRLFKNAASYISKLEVPMITGIKPRLGGLIYNRRIKNVTPLEDRRTIRVDTTYVQIIDTPGHTLGSACYLVNNQILVTGDLLRIKLNKEIVPFLVFQNMNHAEDTRSLEKLQKEGFIDKAEWVLSAHTGVKEQRK